VDRFGKDEAGGRVQQKGTEVCRLLAAERNVIGLHRRICSIRARARWGPSEEAGLFFSLDLCGITGAMPRSRPLSLVCPAGRQPTPTAGAGVISGRVEGTSNCTLSLAWPSVRWKASGRPSRSTLSGLGREATASARVSLSYFAGAGCETIAPAPPWNRTSARSLALIPASASKKALEHAGLAEP